MTATIAILGGGGGVGAAAAFSLLQRERGLEVVLVGRRPKKVAAHVMDLEQVVASYGGSVRAGGLDALASADVVVLTAALPRPENESRHVDASANAALLSEAVESLGPGWPGSLVVVTNPVDALCTWLPERHGLAPERVVGFTVNDSLRARNAVAEIRGVGAERVEAWVLGEHGTAMVPIFSRLRIDGQPVTLDDAERAHVDDFVQGWFERYVDVSSGRSSTWASGAGVATMAEALAVGPAVTLAASTTLTGQYGLRDIALTVPVTLAPSGVREIHEWHLADDEMAGLRNAAEQVRARAAELSLPATSA